MRYWESLVTEDDTLAFVRDTIKSVWALELLLLMRRERERSWSRDDLVRELRSSDAAIGEAVVGLRNAGFLANSGADGLQYWPASPDLERIGDEIEAIYAAKPIAVVKAITSAPNDKLRIFADAFKLKGP